MNFLNIIRPYNMNYKPRGLSLLNHYYILLPISLIFLLVGIFLSFVQIIMIISLIFCLYFIYSVLKKPTFGINAVIIWGFIGLGIKRYLYVFGINLPLGLLIDVFLLLTIISVFLEKYHTKDWAMDNKQIVIFCFVWFLYTFLEIANPNSKSIQAWFYAVRGVSLYMVMMIPISILIHNKNKHLNHFLTIWMIISILGTIWALKQKFIGLDAAENLFLSNPDNLSTHILHGKLRHFSFYTDAGQFGAAQAHLTVVAGILFFLKSKLKYVFL